MNEQGKANWVGLLEQVESNLTELLQTVQQRETALAELAAAAESADPESIYQRVETFDERFSQLQTKAERSKQTVTELDQQWAEGESAIREHLERLDELTPKLRTWANP